MKIGYKGTDEDLKCRDFQFKLGETYYLDSENKINELSENQTIVTNNHIKLCSDKAIHYCNKLEDCFKYYSNNGKNRFFEIEVIGNFADEDYSNKSGAKVIKFIRELSKNELLEIKKEQQDRKLDKRLGIETIKNLQENYPNLIIGGSISLYLQGVRLKRFEDCEVDFDITLPYFQLLECKENLSISNLEDRPSGSDYEETMLINGRKADIRIDPKQKYEVVEYKGFKYKVIPLHTIIEAKAIYANTVWGEKHKNDLREMIL